MTTQEAAELIANCAQRMNARYGKVLFDEWALVRFADNRGYLLAYTGPRKEAFQKGFLNDAGCLRASLVAGRHPAGHFEFAHDGSGFGFESFVAAGTDVYLIWNNTVQSMDGISRDPRWLGAQETFLELSERLAADPVLAPACHPGPDRNFRQRFNTGCFCEIEA
jgi:hypothetical protein